MVRKILIDSGQSAKNTLWQTVKSVAASAFGVQSDANYQRDFNQTSFWPFLIVGVGFVAIFVVMLAFLVQWIVA